MSWKDALKQDKEVVLATCSKAGNPRAIIVVSLGFLDDKFLIGACQMKTTLNNIKENGKVSIVAKNNKEYYRIDGEAMIYSSGKYLDAALERSEPPLPKCALAITVREVFDLDKGKKIF